MKALTLALLFTTGALHRAEYHVQHDGGEPYAAATPSHRSRGATFQRWTWYFAATGHAVYCYGPVMTLPLANGDLQKVATFCRDGQAVVPLKTWKK